MTDVETLDHASEVRLQEEQEDTSNVGAADGPTSPDPSAQEVELPTIRRKSLVERMGFAPAPKGYAVGDIRGSGATKEGYAYVQRHELWGQSPLACCAPGKKLAYLLLKGGFLFVYKTETSSRPMCVSAHAVMCTTRDPRRPSPPTATQSRWLN